LVLAGDARVDYGLRTLSNAGDWCVPWIHFVGLPLHLLPFFVSFVLLPFGRPPILPHSRMRFRNSSSPQARLRASMLSLAKALAAFRVSLDVSMLQDEPYVRFCQTCSLGDAGSHPDAPFFLKTVDGPHASRHSGGERRRGCTISENVSKGRVSAASDTGTPAPPSLRSAPRCALPDQLACLTP
jgi:hypothetical protein